MKKFAIAVDGPAGSGKSSVVRWLAKTLNIVYIDSGAMYRSVAYHVWKEKIAIEEEEMIAQFCREMDLKLIPNVQGQQIFLDGLEITQMIRAEEIGNCASKIASYGEVRAILGRMQQEMAKETAVIMDGRDIGTVILPDAEVKFYLDAKPEERAKRRILDLEEKYGEAPDYETVLKEIIMRDKTDMEREHSPLKQAEDAIYIDTTAYSFEEVVAMMLQKINEVLEVLS